jgi:hypothetical protein
MWILRVISGSILGAIAGAAIGWFLPPMLASLLKDWDIIEGWEIIWCLCFVSVGPGATIGFWVGGLLAFPAAKSAAENSARE